MTESKVRCGDIYSLGSSCRLMCGDATNKEDVERLFDGSKPTLVVTSPPYAKQRDYDRPIACWDSMMLGALNGHGFAEDVQMLINLGVIHQNNEWIPYWWEWLQSMRHHDWRIYAQYIWYKNMAIPGHFRGRLGPSHEFVFHINKSTVDANKRVPTRFPGQKRAYRIDVKNAKGKNNLRQKKPAGLFKLHDSVITCSPVRHHESTGHPAQMPKVLAQQLIASWKKDNCIVYDPFAGSGTTIHAAEQESATGLGMEISPTYTAIALARWAKAYPEQKILKIK